MGKKQEKKIETKKEEKVKRIIIVTTKEENEKMLEVIEKAWIHPKEVMIWDEGSHSLKNSLIGGYITILVGMDLMKNGKKIRP